MKNKHARLYHKLPAKKAEKTHWQIPSGSALSLAITSVIEPNQTLVIITPDPLSSLRIHREMEFFMGNSYQTKILSFPGWETLPYDHFSPHEDIISQRLLTLHTLLSTQENIVIVDAATLLHKLPPKNYIASNSFVLEINDSVEIGKLRIKLESYGYHCANKVMEHGEFAVRGSIIDVFPTGSSQPFRIDLFDTNVDSIRIFDIETQLSIKKIDNIKILPAKEYPSNEIGIENFTDSWQTYFDNNPMNCPIYQNITTNKNHPGIEYYLPLFFEETNSFFDYLPENSTIVSIGDIEKDVLAFWSEVEKRYEQLSHDLTHPILKPHDTFISPKQILQETNKFKQIIISDENEKEQKCIKRSLIPYFLPKNSTSFISDKNLLNNIKNSVSSQDNLRILFTAKSIGKCEMLLEKLKDAGLNTKKVDSWQNFIESANKLSITVANIEQPLHIALAKNQEEILLITEAQFHEENESIDNQKLAPTKRIQGILHDLSELQIGAAVVHAGYGIGRYLGLQKITNDNCDAEYLALEYAKQTKLYVPVTSFDLITRYNGVNIDNVPLSHLSSQEWEKSKRKAKEKIRDVAVEILETYANRENKKGITFTKPPEYDEFCKTFPYSLTSDQKHAIDKVIADMTSDKLMDRLICGDVGFGKTEVAMRATFLASYNGKQVAILTPTTLLAQQHFNNFKDRFGTWPVKICLLFRFLSSSELKKQLELIANGEADIVIGTHKLLQKSVKFKNLGMLIVDEEHRFGVMQKEQIKKLANNIDILSLTATPIPRTLNMAFVGIRDFSIIATPPEKRLAIKTFIHNYQNHIIKEAILRETMRGGQIYFLHNNISTIEKMAQKLQLLMPTIKIAIAHGKMRKQELEQVMHDFYSQKINLLLCTTIIESGIDVPTANTIIINRADNFGLAQLHQIRGRVGRSHHQAYAYLITPDKSLLTADAKKRLEAIVAMKDLGTGFTLATHDLEIRGAGELLGEKQSGLMQNIGFTLYMEMLEHAIQTLKNDTIEETPADIKTEIELPISALIPDDYVHDTNLRLVLYKKIASAKNSRELDKIHTEIIDRFGLPPENAKNLFKLAELKLNANNLGIIKINIGKTKGTITFSKTTTLDPKTIINAFKKHSLSYKLINSYSVEFIIDDNQKKIDIIEKILNELK